MPKSVIPVLSTGQDQLTRPVDQIAYILRHAYYNPGWTSSYIEDYLISLQKLYAENHHDLLHMAERLKELLTYSLNTMYNGMYIVTTQVYDIDNLTKGVRIGISDQNQNLILSSDDIRFSNGQCYIKAATEEIE